MQSHKITGKENIKRFMLAGNATFTIKNTGTGCRFTYKVRQKEDDNGRKSPHFVSVLTGSDNTANYGYLGCIFDEQRYLHGRKSRITPDAKSAKAVKWFWNVLMNGKPIPATVEFWHEGKCGKCGRTLTVPESLESGIGPVCKQSGRK